MSNEKESEDTKRIHESAEKLESYLKNPEIGIKTDELMAYCNGLKWKIRPDGHTKQIRDKIIEIMIKYEEDAKKLFDEDVSELKQQLLMETGTKEILELALILKTDENINGFDYDAAANDFRAGEVALHFLANELGNFLVVQGGRAGSQHLQMLQQLKALKAYVGLKDSSKSGTSPNSQNLE